MKSTIGLLAPNNRIRDNTYRALKEEIVNGRLIVNLLEDDDIVKQAEALIAEGAEAIIARGGTYKDIIDSKLAIPIIELNYYAEDILNSICNANKIGDKVIVILTDKAVVLEIQHWKEMIDIDFEMIRFTTLEEIDDIIFKMYKKYDFPVIVGGAITCSKAEKLGLKSVEIDNSDTTIVSTYKTARETIELMLKNNMHLRLLTTVLDNVNDGIIVVNSEGYIEHINNNLSKFFPSVTKRFLNKKIEEAIPELKLILDTMENGQIVNKIISKDRSILNLNAVTVRSDKYSYEVVCTIQDLTEIQKLEKNLRYKLNPKGLKSKYTFKDIFTKNKNMKLVIGNAKEFATTDSTILIYGESGTGKEMIAQSIHNYSHRRDAPFVAVNCGALSKSLLESELFGYVEGAFTGARKGGKAGLFELAHKGTIFLDEINSLSLDIQSRFLRVIEEKEVMRLGSDYVIPLDIRIIIASNENLIRMVELGEFRRDLFYRLNVLEVRIPPLRERKDDIVPLFQMFLNEFGAKDLPISKELAQKLEKHQWKGNIRELKNIVERYSLLKKKMDFDCLDQFHPNTNIVTDELKIDLKELSKTVENLVIDSLIDSGITKTEISNILGISRTALWKKMKDD